MDGVVRVPTGEWFWSTATDRHGKLYWNGFHSTSGLECYIHMSGYNKLTSTTFWIEGQRKVTDRWLNNERTATFDEAKAWIEARDPWDIYNNHCKIPAEWERRR